MAKKVNTKDDFELCYLRHQYLRKLDTNPTKEEFQPFSTVINKTASKTYAIYRKLFFSVGFEYQDIVRVCESHLTAYLGLNKIELDNKKFNVFVEKFVERNKFHPTDEDILDKNKANFTLELKQRMEDLVRISRQKVRNVRGVPMQKFAYFSSKELPQLTSMEILKNYRKYGIKKLDSAIFRSIKKKAKPLNQDKFFFGGLWLFSIPTEYSDLSLNDMVAAGLDPRTESHHRNPEELIIMSEQKDMMKHELRKFTKYKKIATKEKVDMLRSFVELKKDDLRYKSEVRTAISILGCMEK